MNSTDRKFIAFMFLGLGALIVITYLRVVHIQTTIDNNHKELIKWVQIVK